MNAIAPITVRPIARPRYVPAETYEAWIKINAEAVHDYWIALAKANGDDPDRIEYCELLAFAHAQFDFTFPRPQQPLLSAAGPSQKDDSANAGTAGVGVLYPVTCRARYYDAASRILEEEGQLCTHDNTNELGALIEQWINDARDNWEPR